MSGKCGPLYDDPKRRLAAALQALRGTGPENDSKRRLEQARAIFPGTLAGSRAKAGEHRR
jgi:hypothetical protein